jgi:hypothetical protein
LRRCQAPTFGGYVSRSLESSIGKEWGGVGVAMAATEEMALRAWNFSDWRTDPELHLGLPMSDSIARQQSRFSEIDMP